jgi:hypothetical protein
MPSVDVGAGPARSAASENGYDREQLLLLADLTLAEYLRHLARYGGAIREERGLLLFRGAHPQPNPYRNGALRLDAALPPGEVLERAAEFFSASGGSYALWAREHADADLDPHTAGLRELERLPELVMYEPPEPLAAPAGVELRRATDARTREDYLAVVANAWGMRSAPTDLAARVFFDPDSLDAPHVAAFVAYHDDRPLSAAMTLVTHGVALGCQAATIRRPAPGQRLPRRESSEPRRGLAGSCLAAALDLSFAELGARLSLCQTSGSGAPVWRELGYVPFTSYGRYVVNAGRRVPAAARR